MKGTLGTSDAIPERAGNRQAEVFAELFALRLSGETALWNEVAGYIPRLCQAVERILARG